MRTVASLFILVVGCSNASREDVGRRGSAILPLVAVQDDGREGLAGTVDPSNGDAWLTSTASEAVAEVMEREGLAEASLVVLVSAYASSFDVATGEGVLDVVPTPGLELRACVVDDATGRRWTVAEMRVGAADELGTVPEDYAPSMAPEVELDGCGKPEGCDGTP